MQAIIKGLEKVNQEFAASENDGPVSEVFRKVFSVILLNSKFLIISGERNRENSVSSTKFIK